MEVLQPLTRGISTGDISRDSACSGGDTTYLGTDCGSEGTGMWHSLSGLMEDKDDCLDLARCFPLVRAEYQPSCVGASMRAKGAGSIRLVLKSDDERVVWWATGEVPLGGEWQELEFAWDPADVRRVKSLHWEAEPGSVVDLDSLSLRVHMPELSLEEELFLLSYAKMARLYSQGSGTVKERALRPAGERDSVASAGLFCLATSVACKAGLVKQAQAEQILRKVHATVSDFQTASGLLPAAVNGDGRALDHPDGATYGTLDTSLYYHGMLLAAQVLWDGRTLAGLVNAIRDIDFESLRDVDGFAVNGLGADGRTPEGDSLRCWGSETTLVMLLEHMATGSIQPLRLEGMGEIRGGVGLSAELGAIFYADFSGQDTDAVTGADWLDARRTLLGEQIAFFPRKRGKSAAARLGLYGLTTGEDPLGEGIIAGGTQIREKHEIIRPYYMLMAGTAQPDLAPTRKVLTTLKEQGLVQPWGIVSAFDRDLEYWPLVGSLSAALECLAAYHLLVRSKGEGDLIYKGVEDCGLLREAIRAFYPATKTW